MVLELHETKITGNVLELGAGIGLVTNYLINENIDAIANLEENPKKYNNIIACECVYRNTYKSLLDAIKHYSNSRSKIFISNYERDSLFPNIKAYERVLVFESDKKIHIELLDPKNLITSKRDYRK